MKLDRKKTGAVMGIIFCPIIHFYLLEAYTHNPFLEVRPWSQLFNVMLFEIMAWILFLVFRNVKWALRMEGIFAMGIGLVNYYVYSFRSLPLVPWDIFSIGTAFSVADNYSFKPTFRVVAVVVCFLVCIWLEGLFEWKLSKWKWYASSFGAVMCTVVFCVFSSVLQQEEFQNSHRMYNKLFTPVHMWKVNGFALTMVMELPYLSIDKPEGYQQENAKAVLASYENTEHVEQEKLPNIIVIMDEAFSDLSVLGEFQASEDYMPYFHSLFQGADNTITGYLNVSVCGGNTANTEFEFLTGNTMAFLPQGSVPYQQYLKKETPALPAYLQSLGYETFGMHPYYAEGWDRDTVYPLLGFEHTQFIDNYRAKRYIRNYVSDQTCVDNIIEKYESKEAGKPMFVFNVTMQNHGGYSEIYENFTPHITVEGTSSVSLSTYLSLLQKTDEALENLISYFDKQEEPTMVVFFGDHQPNDAVAAPILQMNGMDYAALSEEEIKLRYQVPYLIWTNYEMETVNRADTSANYLGTKVLEAAGIEAPAYQNFLGVFSDSYPILSAVRREKAADATLELEDYEKLQYYQLFDRKD